MKCRLKHAQLLSVELGVDIGRVKLPVTIKEVMHQPTHYVHNKTTKRNPVKLVVADYECW